MDNITQKAVRIKLKFVDLCEGLCLKDIRFKCITWWEFSRVHMFSLATSWNFAHHNYGTVLFTSHYIKRGSKIWAWKKYIRLFSTKHNGQFTTVISSASTVDLCAQRFSFVFTALADLQRIISDKKFLWFHVFFKYWVGAYHATQESWIRPGVCAYSTRSIFGDFDSVAHNRNRGCE